jgi:hypothetical protein
MSVPQYLIHHPGVLDLICLVVAPVLLFVISMIVGWLRHRLRRGLVIGAVIAIAAAATWLYGREVGFARLEVNHIELAFADLPPAFDGYRIVQFSDVHAGTYTDNRRHILQRVVDSINAQRGDLIVFTGDLQNAYPQEIKQHADILSQLKAPDGVISVLGNHDYGDYAIADEITKSENVGATISEEQELGWRVLCNGHRRIRRGSDSIVVAGMENDGEGRFPQKGDIVWTLRGLHRTAFVVMLEHDPTSWRRKILPHSPSQLTLSGHTHGGQFSIFGWSPAALNYREWGGLYRAGNRYLYVSRGIGGVVPFRLASPAEITVITLRRQKQ